MFSVGDHVVYPYHGAGKVQDIEEKEILGKKLNYFIVFFPLNNVTLMLPENKIGDSGLRSVIQESELAALRDALTANEAMPPENKSRSYSRENELLLKTGSIFDAAHVIAQLTAKEASRTNGLHIEDRKNLDRAQQFVLSELKAVPFLTDSEAVHFLERHRQHTP
ncbi:CarD family transcriptional regulator [Salisediminibacterium halotolerans]|uniref:CarD family transcriptional regulator n=1 Tax=Salisediminibacterium halotolerans TaxID=517425 RepID=A0A1H9S9S0_9BACI|nr:CarD family transcriptional regulator [Salisediminibacterium haloalkalitolerans]SER81123.1 CarD family transcriptional regulator [Salisediminibacterium haloalkalitolerans]